MTCLAEWVLRSVSRTDLLILSDFPCLLSSPWIYFPVFQSKQEFIHLVKCLGKTLYITKRIVKVISAPSISFCAIYVQNKLDRRKFPRSLSVLSGHLHSSTISSAIDWWCHYTWILGAEQLHWAPFPNPWKGSYPAKVWLATLCCFPCSPICCSGTVPVQRTGCQPQTGLCAKK